MRRKGETLMEFVVALTVFGMMTAGIFEFMANQTENLADIRNKDDLIYHAQRYMNTRTQEDGITCTIDTNSDGTFLTVTNTNNNNASMKFELKP